MCVILHFEKGASIDPAPLTNAVHNNPHGWGIIVFGEEYQNGMYVEHNVPEDGETDPEDIINLLKQYEGKERILHLRWATVGEVTRDNAHPFQCYEADSDATTQAWFMHNGTLSGFGSDQTRWYGYYDEMTQDWVDDDDVSDSRDFNHRVLVPYLDRWEGDYQDWHFQNLVEAFWTGSSRGVIVSNYAKPWVFGGKWGTMDPNKSVGTIKISNDTYFDRVERGPEFERRQEALRKAREADRIKKAESGAKATNFLEVIPWDTLDNPPVNFDRLAKCFRDVPLDAAPTEVFNIIRGLTNDEVAHLLVAEFCDIKAGDFDPESSLAYNLILAYSHFFEILLSEVENHTEMDAEEVIDARSVA